MKTVDRLFDAMRARDSVSLRGLSLQRAADGHGGAQRCAGRRNHLHRRLRQGHRGAKVSLNERIWDSEVRVDGDLATVWTKYDFLRAGAFSHCGVDAFQLARTPEGWKIIQIADTHRQEGCWHKPGS